MPAESSPADKPAQASKRLALAAGILVVFVATFLALAFAPGLRETRAGRTIRFWQPVPPPEPAVQPGALGEEMAEQTSSSGAGTIAINEATAESLGLQTATVELQSPHTSLRTTGRVAADERRRTTVTTKVEGFVEQTFANFEGQEVRKGQPLFTVYSPDLLATQQELLIAIRARKDFSTSEFEVVRASGPSLVESARRRLELWDMSSKQIAEVERTGKAFRAVTMYAPASGVIVERKVLPGAHIGPDMPLYALADLSSVWIEADVFEADISGVGTGTRGEITLPWGEKRSARVTFVNPMVEAQTRTVRVRLELPNPGLRLKPGMFVDVSLEAASVPQLAVPRDAVLDTGTRKLVLVAGAGGQFTLREVTTGTQGQELTTILSGLAAGARVARNIQFLVDSETPLREAFEQQPGGSAPGAPVQATAPTPTLQSAPMQPMPGMSGGEGRP